MQRSEMADVLAVSLQAGRILLENGANTSRVEEAVHRLGTGLGADWMEVFVTPTGIIATLISDHEHRTRIQRVTRTGVQLGKLAEVLKLVSSARTLGLAEVQRRLVVIDATPRRYAGPQTAVAVGAGCAALGLLFGGTFHEVEMVFVTATLAQLVRLGLAHTRLGRFLTTALVAAFATGGVLWLTHGTSAVALAASVLMLVPGVPLVSSTADLFRGDILAGMARGTDALLTVLMGSAGVWAVILAVGRRGPVTLELPGQESVLLVALAGALTSLGFAVLFGVPPRALGWASLVGAVAVLARNATLTMAPPEVANLVAGMTIGISAELLSRFTSRPYSFFAIPGYIPLVPGTLFFTGILNLAAGDSVAGVSLMVKAGFILLAIAVGLGSVPAIFETRERAMA